MPSDIWLNVLPYLEPPELLSIILLNRSFSSLVVSRNLWQSWATVFPAKFRSISIPWHDIFVIRNSTFQVPHNSGSLIHDYPKSREDFASSEFPHLATPAQQFFTGCPSKRLLQSVLSQVRGYHRKLWRYHPFGSGMCTVRRVSWDKPYLSSEDCILQSPPGMIRPPGYPLWGDVLMWIELKEDPLTVVHLNGLILFAKDCSAQKKFLHFWRWKWLSRDTSDVV